MSTLEAVGWALVHFVWQGAVVALVVAMALASARRASASIRYALSVGALFAMVALPVGTAWRLMRAPAPVAIDSMDPIDTLPVAMTAGAQATPAPATTRATPGPISVERSRVDQAKVGPTVADQSARSRASVQAPGAANPRFNAALPWLVGAWAAGVLVLSLRLIGGWLRARRLSARGVAAAPEPCRAAVARLAARLDVRRTVRVLESRLIEVPVAMGWLRPVVLLPTSALTGLSVDQLDAILAHELAHIRRHDYLVNLAQSVIETLLFYHPAVWWVSRQVREEREHCCDDLAVVACGNREGYARALVGMERLRRPLPFLVVRANGGSLVMRVRRLLTPELSHAEPAPRWAASVIALATALTVGAAAGVPAVVSSVPFDIGRATGAAAPVAASSPLVTGQPPTVVQAANSDAPLADRWAWAEREASTRAWARYWIGYSVRPPAALHGFFYSDRSATVVGDGTSFSGTFSGEVANLRFPGVAIAPLVGGDDPRRIKILFSFTSGGAHAATLGRTHASSLGLPVDLDGLPLLWLGQADAAQSIPLVRRLYASERDLKVRADLVSTLGLHDDSSLVVAALARILAGDDPPSVRAEAAERLGWHSVPASLDALERAARTDRAADVRREAVETIGDLDLPGATDTLVSFAKTLSDGDARREAVEALGQRPEAAARDALVAIAKTDRDGDIQREAVETLGELKDQQGVAALVDIARTHPSVDVRREAVETLGEAMPADQVIAILGRIAREDPAVDVQREAVETLGEIKDARTLPALVDIVHTHPDSDVRRQAVETIGETMPADKAVTFLARVAREDQQVDVQREAVETLGEIHGAVGVPALLDLARAHSNVDVRREAVETLGEVAPSADIVEFLARSATEDADSDVQREAVETLGEIADGRGLGAVATIALTHPRADVRREAIETLAEHAPQATTVDVLSRVVANDRDEDVLSQAVEALAGLPHGAGVPALIDIARSHPSKQVRAEALKQLVESEDPRARAVFERALAKP